MPMSQRDRSLYVREVEARLSSASEAGHVVEIIFALRGRIVGRSEKGRRRWRICTRGGRLVAVRPETILAITPVAPRAKRRTPEHPDSEGTSPGAVNGAG